MRSPFLCWAPPFEGSAKARRCQSGALRLLSIIQVLSHLSPPANVPLVAPLRLYLTNRAKSLHLKASSFARRHVRPVHIGLTDLGRQPQDKGAILFLQIL